MPRKFVRVGRRRLNLEYVIEVEEHDGSADSADLVPGGARAFVFPGRVLNLTPVEAGPLLRAVDEEIAAEVRAPGTVGQIFVPNPLGESERQSG